MNLNLFPFLMAWSVLAAVVLAMIVARKVISRHEEPALHLTSNALVSSQANLAHKLDLIDKWGKALTVIALVSGLLLATIYVWQIWVRGATLTGL
jgi:hypothetical protein